MKEIGVLLELQELDTKLTGLMDERGTIPLQIKELDKEVGEMKEQLEKQDSDSTSLKVAIRDAEGKVALLDESVTRYKQQLLAVKTNREYSALLTEIEGVKREKEELEEQIIRNMELIETLTSQIKETKAELKRIKKESKGRKDELAERIKELDDRIAVCGNKRDVLVKGIDKPLVKLYERIMKSRVKLAVVPLRNGSCGGCFAFIPLQKVADIRISAQVYTCDSCGRILYFDETKS